MLRNNEVFGEESAISFPLDFLEEKACLKAMNLFWFLVANGLTGEDAADAAGEACNVDSIALLAVAVELKLPGALSFICQSDVKNKRVSI
jgi:hypothetical protein